MESSLQERIERAEFLDWFYLMFPSLKCEAGFVRRETWPPVLRSNLRFQFSEMASRYRLKTRSPLPYGVRVHTSRTMKKPYGSP